MPTAPRTLGSSLRSEAKRANERRLIVVHGEREHTNAAAAAVLDGANLSPTETTLIGEDDKQWATERLAPRKADDLLGATRQAVVVDAHGTCRPNALGQVAGVVDGGGLLLYLTPPAERWPGTDCAFHRSLAVPQHSTDQVGARYHRRLHDLARIHEGIAVYDANDDTVERNGRTNPAPLHDGQRPPIPDEHRFPEVAYEACRTRDQVDAVLAFERLVDRGVIVIEADRGRGKSSAAGLAVAAMAHDGLNVLVTAPNRQAVRPLFERTTELLDRLGHPTDDARPNRMTTRSGGTIAFLHPEAAAKRIEADADTPDALIVDEAASLPVRLHERYFDVDRLAFITTVHGYEGTGRGFDVRVKSKLQELDRPVTEIQLVEPIRYAGGDPVEVYVFRVLALNARPAVDPVVEDVTVDAVTYRTMEPDRLIEDDHLLREAFGLLVSAHYRTEPNDLVRVFDAPNVRVRALTVDRPSGEHVAAVALLAAEGGLSASTRAGMYEGDRVAGNMIPDVLTAHLRDEQAAGPRGSRILRIATHHRIRSRGLGSELLNRIESERRPELDWLGVGFGGTPELIDFWARNGYDPVHLSLRRNDRSGERSVIMLRPVTDRGHQLVATHRRSFAKRLPGVLGDPLRDANPELVRSVLRAHPGTEPPDLDAEDWRHVVGAAYGSGLFDVNPTPFRRLALHHLLGSADEPSLTPEQERLVIAKVLQARTWDAVTEALGFVSRSECRRALGRAFRPLVDRYGTDVAHSERNRFTTE